MSTQNRWSSHLNFILAATGAAVGLGSIWKFPYMVGENGGGMFILLWAIAMLCIGLPALMAEIMLGKLAHSNPIHALKNLALANKVSKHWQALGILGSITLLLVLAFYSVISGWVLAYIYKACTHQIYGADLAKLQLLWSNFLSDPIALTFWHAIFMLLTIGIVALGVQIGLELASKIMMPGLFIILIFLTLYSMQNGDLTATMHFFFSFNLKNINSGVLLNAIGQAAFSLAIGAGCMLTYGCYLEDKSNIAKNSIVITCCVFLVSILAGLATLPIAFKANLPLTSGPDLMFQTLPIAFATMPFGSIIGALFFILLFFAALTSSVSLAEPLVLILMEHTKISRFKACLIIGSVAFVIGLLALSSFNITKDVVLFGKYNFFTLITDLSTNILLPVGIILFSLFAGWIIKNHQAQQALEIKSRTNFKLWQFAVRFIVPMSIIVTLIPF